MAAYYNENDRGAAAWLRDEAMSIQANIAARLAAKEVYDLAAGMAPFESEQRFWDILAAMVAAHLPKPEAAPASLPMSDETAAMWARQQITFGKHVGTPIKDVPLAYLVWLAESPDPFRDELRRYLASPCVRLELGRQDVVEDEDDDGIERDAI